MELKTAKARPIEQEGRFIVLVFGPDRELKTIAAHARARWAGYSVNIRSTDNPADSYAEHTPCHLRIIVDTPMGRRFAQMYEEAGLAFKLMRWDGEALHDSDGKPLPQTLASADLPILRLTDGSIVERAPAIERAAKAMGMSVAALSALDDETIIATIELALAKQPEAPQKRKRAPRAERSEPLQKQTPFDA